MVWSNPKSNITPTEPPVRGDDTITFETHINSVCKTSSWLLRKIWRICTYLDKPSLEILIHAFVTKKLSLNWSPLIPCRKLYTSILLIFLATSFYWVAKPSRNLGFISWVFLFSVSVKVLPVTPLLSGGFVHRAFCAYFLRIERVVENA